MREFENTKAWYLLCKIEYYPTTWVYVENMTDEEKANNSDYEILGGYLRKNDLMQVNQKWWESLTESEKDCIKSIENFDADIFEEIMGIDVELSEEEKKD